MSHCHFYKTCEKFQQEHQKGPKLFYLRARLWCLITEIFAWFMSCVPFFIFFFLCQWWLMGSSITLSAIYEDFSTAIHFILIFAYVALKILLHFQSFPQHHTIRITADDAPELFEVIKAVCGDTFKKVYLSNDDHFYAYFKQPIPFIPYYRYNLGMSIWALHYLSVEELKVVLHHELVHAQAPHYKTCKLYPYIALLRGICDEEFTCRWLFQFLGKKLKLRLEAYSTIISQEQEREADEFSAQRSSAEEYSLQRLKFTLGRQKLTDIWTKEKETFNHSQKTTPEKPFSTLCENLHETMLKADFYNEKWQKEINNFLNRKSRANETHPADIDRVNAHPDIKNQHNLTEITAILHASLKKPLSLQLIPAASLKQILSEFDLSFHNHLKVNWERAEQEIQKQEDEYQKLLDLGETLTEEQAWEKIITLYDLHRHDVVKSHLKQYLEKYPNHLNMNYLQGKYLYEDHNQDAFDYLIKSSETYSPVQYKAFYLLDKIYASQGDHQKSHETYIECLKSIDILEKEKGQSIHPVSTIA